MPDDPRIKIVLKRYRKDEAQCSDSVELTGLPFALLSAACRHEGEDFLARPRAVDHQAQVILAARIGMDFDPVVFDYFLHPYVRREFLSTYYIDPSIKVKPCSEAGPPAGIPIPDGMEWAGVRPQNGEEHFIAIEKKPSNQLPAPTSPSDLD